jgi:hypothetical protein
MASDYQQKLETSIREKKPEIMERDRINSMAGGTSSTKESIQARILVALEKKWKGTKKPSSSGQDFIFYRRASVVRDPSTGASSAARIINGSIDDQPDISAADIDIRAHDPDIGNDRGFYVLKDGSVVIEMPATGKIEYFADGQAARQTLADDGWNYKC